MSQDTKPRNAADSEKIQEQARREKNSERQELEDFRWALQSPAGRRLLWGLMSECGVFSCSFTGNATTYFNEGKRDVGLKILGKITSANPEALVQMMTESKRREEANG